MTNIQQELQRLALAYERGQLSKQQYDFQVSQLTQMTSSQSNRHPNMLSQPSLAPNPNAPYPQTYPQQGHHHGQMVPGAWLAQYQLVRKLGAGGMAEVWLARRNGQGYRHDEPQMVALKALFDNFAKQPRTVQRFGSEIQTGMRVHHANFTKIFGGFNWGVRPIMVMEFVEGRPLSTVIGDEVGPIAWERALPIFEQLLHVVGHLHNMGLVHRDIKPENIIINHQNHIKLLDLGIAKDRNRKQFTMVNQGFGTVSYMAPEQYRHAKDVDHRADIYALGMTLYEMLAGHLPWEDDETDFNIQVRKNELSLPSPRQFYPEIPSWVVNAIHQALQTNPEERFNSVNEFYGALKLNQSVQIVEDWRLYNPDMTGDLPFTVPMEDEVSAEEDEDDISESLIDEHTADFNEPIDPLTNESEADLEDMDSPTPPPKSSVASFFFLLLIIAGIGAVVAALEGTF